ncbi:MAG: 16S rRNA (cytosine(1402)-N(4))-methyltransferase RsmH [Akkermansiaceae bacterium]|nr:16S rRNA (cytosine(1402)-N(4))-methyltransferase RsmH [Armatimonadota bacterium]
MSAYHKPVLLAECLEALNLAPGRRVVDGTLGGGGHARAIAEKIAPGGILIALDQDADAIAEATKTLADVSDAVSVRLRQTNFAEIAGAVAAEGIAGVDGVLLDLGVSSHQLDTADRGFAFRYVGPLDMRMNRDDSDTPTAADLVNMLPEAQLARIFFEYGEESRSRRIAAEIVTRRRTKPFVTTEDLVDAVRGTMPLRTRAGEIHPATKVFQALRIAVNKELEVLETALRGAASVLAPGGRLVVMSYHSLEDRIVKNIFAELSGKRVETDLPDPTPRAEPILTVLTKKPVAPTDTETRANPRARSAKLRVAERRG